MQWVPCCYALDTAGHGKWESVKWEGTVQREGDHLGPHRKKNHARDIRCGAAQPWEGMNVRQLKWGGWTQSLLHGVKSDREKQKRGISAYTIDMESRQTEPTTSLQRRNGDADTENGLGDTGEGVGGTNWESGTDTYAITCETGD